MTLALAVWVQGWKQVSQWGDEESAAGEKTDAPNHGSSLEKLRIKEIERSWKGKVGVKKRLLF